MLFGRHSITSQETVIDNVEVDKVKRLWQFIDWVIQWLGLGIRVTSYTGCKVTLNSVPHSTAFCSVTRNTCSSYWWSAARSSWRASLSNINIHFQWSKFHYTWYVPFTLGSTFVTPSHCILSPLIIYAKWTWLFLAGVSVTTGTNYNHWTCNQGCGVSTQKLRLRFLDF
jgi:hypothetical protein